VSAPPGGAEQADVRVNPGHAFERAAGFILAGCDTAGVNPAARPGEGQGAASATTWMIVAVLLAVGLLLPFHQLGERDLWSSHEARAAMDARSLLQPLPGQPAGLPWMDD